MSPVQKAIRRRPFWALGIAVLVASVLGGYSSILLSNDAREAERDREVLCEAVNGANSSLRNLLVAARAQTPPERMTPEARRFYREQIEAVQPLDCANFDRDSLRRQLSAAPSRRRVRQPGTRADPSEAARSPENGSASPGTAPKVPDRGERPSDTRPPASTNPPDTTPDRFPPPVRVPPGPGVPPPPEPPPPARNGPPAPVREAIDEQRRELCARLPTLPVCR